METAEKDQKALLLRKAGASLTKIRKEVGFRDVRSVEKAIDRALDDARKGKEGTSSKQLELERIDDLYKAQYPAALRGDAGATSLCMELMRLRMRLSGEQTGGDLTDALETTLEELNIDEKGKDAAVVMEARILARQIDTMVRYGVGTEVTKALYLIPHLTNQLRELGATPSARETVKSVGQESPQEPRDDLSIFRKAHQI